jgi:hypothetical protein
LAPLENATGTDQVWRAGLHPELEDEIFMFCHMSRRRAFILPFSHIAFQFPELPVLQQTTGSIR